MAERIFNINGVLYVSRENSNGIYMQRVNADGSDWVDTKPQYTGAERASGITIGPAPARIDIARKRSWWRFWG